MHRSLPLGLVTAGTDPRGLPASGTGGSLLSTRPYTAHRNVALFMGSDAQNLQRPGAQDGGGCPHPLRQVLGVPQAPGLAKCPPGVLETEICSTGCDHTPQPAAPEEQGAPPHLTQTGSSEAQLKVEMRSLPLGAGWNPGRSQLSLDCARVQLGRVHSHHPAKTQLPPKARLPCSRAPIPEDTA